jgi:hypothetical protein
VSISLFRWTGSKFSDDRFSSNLVLLSSSGNSYDPIYTASIQPNNTHLHTVFSSPNSMLTLVSVTPFWAVALKLVRYTKWDPGDICLLLRFASVVLFHSAFILSVSPLELLG